MTSHSSHQGHDPSHTHAEPKVFNRAFFIAIVANGVFVIAQFILAYFAHSTSLAADAVHNLGDVFSLVLAWIANSLLKRLPTDNTTYGMKKTSILTAFANGMLLVFSCGFIASNALYKLFNPNEIASLIVMSIAFIGIIVNGSTALLFIKGNDDLNIRSAFLHLLYDAIISMGVVVSSLMIYFTNWQWLDPLAGLIIALIVIKGTWSLFTDSFRLMIDGVPRGVSLSKVQQLFLEEPGVEQLHDLHIWALSTKENALSVHLWMPNNDLSDVSRQKLLDALERHHNIHHVTIQVEKDLIFCKDACAAI